MSNSNPGLVNGQIPTAGQWNGYFATKQDWTPLLDGIVAGTSPATNIIGPSVGGTGLGAFTKGAILYASSTSALALLAAGSNGYVLTLAGGVPTWASAGVGTVTSVAVSGGTTGLTTSGGPITGSGTITFAGTLAVANGGTGSATQNFVDLSTTQASIAGVKTFTGQLIGKGTATNDSAASGYIGEYVSSTVAFGSAVSLTSASASNITSISLTAGDWDVWGNVGFAPSGITSYTSQSAYITTTSVTDPGPPNGGAYATNNPTGNGGGFNVLSGLYTRISLSTTTTVYLGALVSWTGGTMKAYGAIGARRVR
jgi:hypothetical protein